MKNGQKHIKGSFQVSIAVWGHYFQTFSLFDFRSVLIGPRIPWQIQTGHFRAVEFETASVSFLAKRLVCSSVAFVTVRHPVSSVPGQGPPSLSAPNEASW